MKKELILIDASWVIHRMWYVHSNLSVTLKNGVELKSGHVYGFARLLKTLTTSYPEADIIVCLDGNATHGKELNADYKGNREHGVVKTAFDDLGVLVECAVAFKNTKVAFHKHLEADELISYFCYEHKLDYDAIIIYSADGDMVQLLDGNVFIAKEFERGFLKLVDQSIYLTDPKYVNKFLACSITALPLYRAIVGDSSDNLSGFPRIRKKLARDLAEKYVEAKVLAEAVEENEAEFPVGFKDFLPTLKSNYEIMKLPTPYELTVRGTLPNIFDKDEGDIETAKALFSLYRIKSTSPVETFEISPDVEESYLILRDSVNAVWKHPNSNK